MYICSLHFESLSGQTDQNPEPFRVTLSEKDLESRLIRSTMCGKDKRIGPNTCSLDLNLASASTSKPNLESALDISILSGDHCGIDRRYTAQNKYVCMQYL